MDTQNICPTRSPKNENAAPAKSARRECGTFSKFVSTRERKKEKALDLVRRLVVVRGTEARRGEEGSSFIENERRRTDIQNEVTGIPRPRRSRSGRVGLPEKASLHSARVEGSKRRAIASAIKTTPQAGTMITPCARIRWLDRENCSSFCL